MLYLFLKMDKTYLLLLLLLLCFTQTTFGQISDTKSSLKKLKLLSFKNELIFGTTVTPSKHSIKVQLTEKLYTQHLPFFCQTERWLEQKTSIPITFRVGSLAYTNYLEQKPNSRFFY